MIGMIGGYLIEDSVLTLEQLDAGLAYQYQMGAQGQVKKLGEVLVELNFVTAEQLQSALQRQGRDSGKLRTTKESLRSRLGG